MPLFDPSPQQGDGLEVLLDTLKDGLAAERVLLQTPEGAPAEGAHVLQSPLSLADGTEGVLFAERRADAPAFDDTERRLFFQLAGIAETVLRAAVEARRRSERIADSQAIASALGVAASVEAALAIAAEAVLRHSGCQAVAATLLDRATGAHTQVAVRTRDGLTPEPSAERASVLVTPVVAGGEPVARLEASDECPEHFTRSDAEMMERVAESLGAAWESILHREETDRRSRRLSIALEVTRDVAAATSAEGALAAAAGALVRSTAYRAVVAVLADPAHGEQMLVGARTEGGELSFGLRRPIDEGLTGRVIREARSLCVDQGRSYPERRSWQDEPMFESMVIVPILVDGICMGTIEVGDERPGWFGNEDVLLLETAAEQVAATLRRIGLRQESARRADRLALTAELAHEIAAAGSIEEALAHAAKTVFDRAGFSATWAYVALPEDGQQLVVSYHSREPSPPSKRRRPIGEGIVGEVIRTGRPLLIGQTSRHPLYSSPTNETWESMLAMPVMLGGQCRAVLTTHEREPNRLSHEDMVLMSAIAEQVSASLRGVELRDLSERRARRLALTAEIAKAIASVESVEDGLQATADLLFAGTGYQNVSVIRCLHDRGEAAMTISLSRQETYWIERRWPIGKGVTARTIESGEVMRLGHASSDPDYIWQGEANYDSLVQAPVIVDGRCEAVLELADAQPDRYNDDDEALMRTVAEQVAAAMRGALVREESERRAERLAITLEVAQAVEDADTVEETLRAAADTIRRKVMCDGVAAFIALPTGEQLAVVDADAQSATIEGMRRPAGVGYTGKVFESGRQLRIGRATRRRDFDPWLPDSFIYESVLLTPIRIEGRATALIGLYDQRRNRFDAEDALLMRTVAEQVAAAMRGTRLRAESGRRAERLALTLDVAKAVAAADTVEDALRATARTVLQATDYRAVSAVLVDVDGRENNVISGELRSGEPPDDDRSSVLVTSVQVDGRNVAKLLVEGAELDEQDRVLMQTVAEQVSAALRGLGLRDQSAARAERLEHLESRHRALLERLVRAQEQERSRVAADLHDDTVQVLSACVIALDRVRHAVELGNVERAASALGSVSELMAGAVERTRRMTFELRPAVLWHHGLEPALRQLLETLERETGIEARLRMTVSERADPTLETIAFRSIAELVGNVRSHAQANLVEVTVEQREGRLAVEVRDDGRGFHLDPALARARATNHLGLETLMERIDATGGTIEIETEPGEGTAVRLEFPIRPRQNPDQPS
jgi:signal transduction histidine kinase/putative methionine-R-sulfoxide reductase with GAF domain